MKRFYMTLAAGVLALGSVTAQTTIATLGFEPGDVKGRSSQYSLTVLNNGGENPSTYGDWVNQKGVDAWTEAFADEKHSGEYAFRAVNGAVDAPQSWDRGFKIAGLPLKEETSYRVSFWVKGTAGSRLSSWLSKGVENFERGICTPTGQSMGLDQVTLTGDWQHMSFVTFYGTADLLNQYIAEKESWRGAGESNLFPEAFGGTGEDYSTHFEGKLPEEFFFIANMFSNDATYVLDDIQIEEGVTFNQATFVDDAIRLDFGYATNIADLAKAEADGVLHLDPASVTVTINGTPAPVEYVEGQQDGFLYVFLQETYASEGDEVRVSWTPAADSPILYKGDKRPSTDAETALAVPGFKDEPAWFDADISALPSAWAPATMVSSWPENESFEIVGADFKDVTVTFDKDIDVSSASATLSQNGVVKSIDPATIVVKDGDARTVVVPVGALADGDWTFTLTGVMNSFGVDCLTDQTFTFTVGEDHDTGTSEEVYATDFDNEPTNCVPEGWVTYNDAGFHIYGFNDDGSQYNYAYGQTPGGGGTRLFEGFSGDFKKALYWGTRGTNEGYAEFGSQVKQYLQADGTPDPEMPEGIALKLEARKYQVSFLMAAWKDAPMFNFTLEDLDGNVYAKFTDYVAAPNMNGAQGPVSGSVKCVTDFTVPKEGYYVLRFTSQEAQWKEFLLANVKVITMPSKAAYYKGLLANARETAESILAGAEGEAYDGETKTALAAAIEQAKGHFTQPSEITALIDQLGALGEAMQARVANIDSFEDAILTAMTAQAELEGTKYEATDLYKAGAAAVARYAETNASALTDAELAEATPAVKRAAAQLGNVKSCTDDLTWQVYKAGQIAQAFGSELPGAYWSNVEDNPALAARIVADATLKLYQAIAADTLSNVPTTTYEADGLSVEGYDFTGLVRNSRFYTLKTDNGVADDTTFPGWSVEQPEAVAGGNNFHFSGDVASEEKPVSNVMANNWKCDYTLSQTLTGVPAGVYTILINCRTSAGFNSDVQEDGTYDKYIFATAGEQTYVQKFAEGGWGTHFCAIEGVEVTDGTVTIGAVEKNSAQYETNTFVDDARVFLTAKADKFDYAKAAQELADGIEAAPEADAAVAVAIYSVSGSRQQALQPGINIVKMSDGSVRKVLVK